MTNEQNATQKFIVKDENITAYEIEANDNFSYDRLSEEELAEIHKCNETFMNTVVQSELLIKAMPCVCQHGRIIERTRTRMKILNKDAMAGQIPIQIEQEDIDTKKFGVILHSDNGKLVGIGSIVTECKQCHEVHIYGNAEVITRLIANGYSEYMNMLVSRADIEDAIEDRCECNDECSCECCTGDCSCHCKGDTNDTDEVKVQDLVVDDMDPSDSTFVSENIETGEVHDADSIVRMLSGK